MSTNPLRLAAIRGATTCTSDSAEEICNATEELLQEMLGRNGAGPEDLVSVIFTSTADLVSDFPAAAARKIGLSDVPLLCAAEIAVPGSLERCIRVMIHLTTSLSRGDLRHVYLRGAKSLRADLPTSEQNPQAEPQP